MKLPKQCEVFPFRKLPLYTTYQNLINEFGLDVFMFHSQLFHYMIIYTVIYVLSSGLAITYNLNDKFQEIAFSQNISSYFSQIPYSSFRGVVWTTVLFVAIVFVKFQSLERRFYDHQIGKKQDITDFSLVLMEVPPSVTDQDLRSHCGKFIGAENISRFVRIKTPRFLSVQRKIYQVEQEYYDAMNEGEALDNMGCFFAICKFIHIIWLFQIIGFMRDIHYYQNRLKQLEKELKTVQQKFTNVNDAVIITLKKISQVKALLKGIRSFRGKVKGFRLRGLQAPAPEDIILENLQYFGIKGVLKRIWTYIEVIFISILLFVAVSLCRYFSRKISFESRTLYQENTYYGLIFLLMLVFDLALRPFLYVITNIERHRSYSSKEKAWMYKLFLYNLLNKLTLFYSRTIMDLLTSYQNKDLSQKFFDIFGFSTYWRTDSDQGGVDATTFLWIVVFGYNVIEILEFAFYYVFLRMIAKTYHDRVAAIKSEDQRYASKYVQQNIIWVFVLAFGHVQPEICIIAVLYFPIHSVINRFILLRLSRPSPKTSVLVRVNEKFMYFGIVFAGFCIPQSYHLMGTWFAWLTLPLCLFILIIIVNTSLFDNLIKKVDKRFKRVIETDKETLSLMKEKDKVDLDVEHVAGYTQIESEVTHQRLKMMENEYSRRHDDRSVTPGVQMVAGVDKLGGD